MDHAKIKNDSIWRGIGRELVFLQEQNDKKRLDELIQDPYYRMIPARYGLTGSKGYTTYY